MTLELNGNEPRSGEVVQCAARLLAICYTPLAIIGEMMEMFLFRVSTKRTDVWSRKIAKPVYIVAHNKEAAEKWAIKNLADGLSVSKITRLAMQIGGHVFTGV